MSKATVAQEDQLLISALRENEFDIVGLAEFTPDEETLTRCLQTIYRVVANELNPAELDEVQLAHVLIGMVSVAQEDYASDGRQEYWPFLAERIVHATFADPSRCRSEEFLGGPEQRRLGQAFREALDEFDYGIPNDGNVNISPIVFHAGIPKSSLAGAMRVIAQACDLYGAGVASLDAKARGSLVQNYVPRIHANVERLFSSSLLGGEQLWACLARVVLAWQRTGSCETELQLLPNSLDPELVRNGLPSEGSVSRAVRVERPVIRFDAETGEVRLIIPNGRSSDWKVQSAHTTVEVNWTATHVGSYAEFRRPLPATISVEPANSGLGAPLEVETQPELLPGYWFHAHNGNLEPGTIIDANGISPGRWYVLFEGAPTEWPEVSHRQVRLQWGWLEGSSNWTAWEVEVPVRTATRTELVWKVDTNTFSVPLARRPSAHVEVASAVICAACTADGQSVDVFAETPVLRSQVEKTLEVLLIAETTDGNLVESELYIEPKAQFNLMPLAPGVYQLRQKRGVGKLLLRFAVLPKFEVDGPVVDPGIETGCLCLRVEEELGEFVTMAGDRVGIVNGWPTFEFSTVRPLVELKWQWIAVEAPDLIFRWPVEGVRWRILGLSDELAEWTRDSRILSPGRVSSTEIVLEVQYPNGSELSVNQKRVASKHQSTASGDVRRLSLFSPKTGESVVLDIDGETYPAVLFSDRPILETLDALTDLKNMVVEWSSGHSLAGCSLAIWNSSDMLSQPLILRLNEQQLYDSMTDIPFEALPGGEILAVSLVRVGGGLFNKVLHFAALENDLARPVAVSLHRETGETYFANGSPESWEQFLFEARLSCLFRTSVSEKWVTDVFQKLRASGGFSAARALDLLNTLRTIFAREKAGAGFEVAWAKSLQNVIVSILSSLTEAEYSEVLQSSGGTSFLELLSLGIPAGQLVPSHSDTTNLTDHEVYPLQYLRDLQLVSSCVLAEPAASNVQGIEVDSHYQIQKAAVARILRFHEDNELPSVFYFLPLARSTADVFGSDCGHRHQFGLPPVTEGDDPEGRLAELLGIDECCFDCDAASEDLYFSTSQKCNARRDSGRHNLDASVIRHPYSVYWTPEELRWQIERTDRETSPLCCYSRYQPFMTTAWTLKDLVEDLDLRGLLDRWCKHLRPTRASDFDSIDTLTNHLKSDRKFGPLHQEVLRKSRKEQRLLLGKVVTVETIKSIRREAAICWQIAWIERQSALDGYALLFDSDGLLPADFQRLLAKAIQLWPELMRRCLALAELLLWTLSRGGIGVAAKFHGACAVPTYREEQQPASKAPQVVSGTQYRGVTGIVVGYDCGKGLLLFPQQGVDLALARKQFIAGSNSPKYWLAEFNWSGLEKLDRDAIQAEYDRLRPHRASGVTSLSDVLCGRTFRFSVDFFGTWRASEIALQTHIRPIAIPRERRISPE